MSLSLEEWANISAPMHNDTSLGLDRCQMFDLDYGNGGIAERPFDDQSLPTVECTEFEYDESLFQVFEYRNDDTPKILIFV